MKEGPPCLTNDAINAARHYISPVQAQRGRRSSSIPVRLVLI